MRPMREILATAVIAAVAMPTAARAQQEDGYPSEPPPPLEAADVNFPAVGQDTLENGLRLVAVENHEQPVVSVRLYVPAGEVADPDGKTGVSNLTASVLDKGTESRSAEEIASTVEGVGGSLSVGASDDFGFVSASMLTKHLSTVMEVFADVVRNPTFPDDEFDNEKKRMLSRLEVQLSQPGTLASRQFRHRVYGAHPYGEEPTPESVEAVGREDLAAFHRERYTPAGALLVVAGDLDREEAREMAERYLGGWTGDAAPEPAMPEPPARDETRIYLVHRPGSVQSNIWVGHLGIRPDNEDVHAVEVANRVLGGGANARLFLILREEKGWTYGAYSRFTSPRGQGYFAATAEVRSPVTDSALNEMLHQLHRIRDERVPGEELADAKSYLTGHFPLEIETPTQVASQVADALLRGLGMEYLESYRSEISAVDAAAVQEAARRYVRPERAAIVVVGDASQIHEKLEGIAPITLLDTDGEEITPSDLAVRRSGGAMDASRIRRGDFIYSLLFQGNSVARSTIRVEDTEEGNVRVTESLSGAMGSQTTRYVVTPELEPLEMEKGGKMGQRSVQTELSYGDGRVKGSATVPKREDGEEGQGPPEMEQVTVDTAVAEGTVDQNMAMAVILASRLEEGAEVEVPVYSPRTGVTQLTGTVTGRETVEVPAGSFEAWEVQLEFSGQAVHLFVTTEAPHLLVKQTFAEQPLSMELMSVGGEGGGSPDEGG